MIQPATMAGRLTTSSRACREPSLNLLKRASWASLIARREWGGLLVAASKLVTHADRADATVPPGPGLGLYQRRAHHMKLWVFWPRVAKMLQDREESCRQAWRAVRRAGLSTLSADGGHLGPDGIRPRCLTPAAAGRSGAVAERCSGAHRASRDAGIAEPPGAREVHPD